MVFVAGNLAQWGYSQSDLSGSRLAYADLIHPDDCARVAAEVARHLADGPDHYQQEYRLRRADGDYVWIEDRTWLERAADGSVTIIGGVLLDVTERHRLLAAQRDSEARFRAIAEDTPLLICRFLPDLTIDYVNPAYCEYFGLRLEDLVGTSFLRLIPADDQVAVAANIAALSPAAPLKNQEHPVVSAAGEVRWQRWSDRAMFDPHGRLIAYQSVGEDITERKRAEQALAISESRYREAQRVARIGSWELDLGSGRLWWSDECYRIFGIAPAAFGATYEAFLDLVHPEDRAAVQASFAAAMTNGEHYETIHRLLLGDGEIKYVHERGEVHCDPDGQPARALGTVQDVSALEEQVRRRTAELAALNKELEMFTYSVSHDLKAPLRGIDGYSQLLLSDHGDRFDDEGRLFLNNVRQGVAQMNQLIADLLAYSRMERQTLAPAVLDLETALGRVLAERAAEIAARGLVVELDLHRAQVRADADGLALVLRNLLDNALKFTREASTPRLSIRAETGSECVTLCFADNGIGFDMRFHDRLFEMFQRLQRAEDYPGTGVGLAIVRKALQRMGGSIRAEGLPGEGARFYVELPR